MSKNDITVLLVEDELTLAMIIKDTLEENGFTIHTASDGEEGLHLFFELRPDVLVADVMMPKMDGFEMVRRIRQTDKQTPVLFLTARSAINDVVEGFELGANDYLKKPFGMQELIQRIETFFRYNAGRAGACPKILIISPVPMPQTGGDPEFNAESLQKQAGLAAVYKAVAEQYGCAFAAAEDWITPEQLGVDFCHFTPEAHRIFAEKTAELVHQLLD